MAKGLHMAVIWQLYILVIIILLLLLPYLPYLYYINSKSVIHIQAQCCITRWCIYRKYRLPKYAVGLERTQEKVAHMAN